MANPIDPGIPAGDSASIIDDIIRAKHIIADARASLEDSWRDDSGVRDRMLQRHITTYPGEIDAALYGEHGLKPTLDYIDRALADVLAIKP